MNDQLIDTLRLIRSPQIGPVSYCALLRQYGTARESIAQLIRQGKSVCPEKDAMREIKETSRLGGVILSHLDLAYPQILLQVYDFPPVISVLGNPDILAASMIAIVGTRAASLAATKLTTKLSQELSQAGFVVISGLARGIDGAAHKGCLPHSTVAVVAGGVDVLYPPEHKKLREEIIANGAVISEMPLGLFPGAKHFPRRNRLISGLSKGVCVIEAAKPSGSLITAGFALDQGKELFSVPGFPGDLRSAGTNYLLRTGAHVLESAQDVLDVVGSPSIMESQVNKEMGKNASIEVNENNFPQGTENNFDTTSLQQNILTCLSSTPVSVESLLQAFTQPERVIYEALTHLELSDKIIRDANGYVCLTH